MSTEEGKEGTGFSNDDAKAFLEGEEKNTMSEYEHLSNIHQNQKKETNQRVNSSEVIEEKKTGEEEKGAGGGTGGGEDKGEALSWNQLMEEENPGGGGEEFKPLSAEEVAKLSPEEKKTYDEKLTQNLSTFDFKAVSTELGFPAEVNDLSTFTKTLKEHVKQIEKEKEQLKELTKTSGVNEQISHLITLRDAEDEDVVRNDLKIRKMPDTEIEDYIKGAKENNTLVLKAKEVRTEINNVIKFKREELAANAGKPDPVEVAKYKKDLEDFKGVIDKTETMFGFKIADSDDKLKTVRDSHYEYVASGKFASEIYATHENLMEASWLWKNRKVILKAMQNNGFQKGKAEILKHIKEPDTESVKRFNEARKPGEEGTFTAQDASDFADGIK